ncbi:hypothetical protein ACFX1R_045818 [Malus domestica]|nr:glutamic acid-rich protein-like [Malus domestica]
MEMDSLCSNGFVLDSFLCSVVQAVVAEATIAAAAKSLALSCFMMGSMPNTINVFPKKPEAVTEFRITELYVVGKPGPENTDASETEDEDDDDDDAGDDQDEDGGDEDDASGEEKDGKENPEDEPKANGDGVSEEDEDDDKEDEEDDDDDDDDNDDGDDGEEETEDEEEEDEEDEEEDLPQPPAKRRK